MKIIVVKVENNPLITEFLSESNERINSGDTFGAGQFEYKYKFFKDKDDKKILIFSLQSFLPDFLTPSILIYWVFLKGLRKKGYNGFIKRINYKYALGVVLE
jgi:hypothetical protein